MCFDLTPICSGASVCCSRNSRSILSLVRIAIYVQYNDISDSTVISRGNYLSGKIFESDTMYIFSVDFSFGTLDGAPKVSKIRAEQHQKCLKVEVPVFTTGIRVLLSPGCSFHGLDAPRFLQWS